MRLQEGAYGVVVGAGLLAEAPERIRAACPAAQYAIIADATVAELYAHRLATGLGATIHTFPPGEAGKTRATWSDLTDQLLAADLGRDGAIVALGGGVTGDLAGFVAATYLRGVPYVQVPTTILAMVDSAIGGKTGVDSPAGKNLVGAFHQPRLVLADVRTIATLPVAHRRAGLVEAVKHGAIADAAYFDRLAGDGDALLEADPETLLDAIAQSVAIKAAIVEADAHEQGRRMVLNAGHTIGHALEHATNFRLAHGDAVAIGLVRESRLGERLHLTEAGTSERLTTTLHGLGVPTVPPDVPQERVREAVRRDKKNRGGTVRIALIARIGAGHQTEPEVWTTPVDEDLVVAAAIGP